MDAFWIPIVGIVAGTVMVVGVLAVVLHYRLEETRMQINTEIQRMDLAYQRARESFSR